MFCTSCGKKIQDDSKFCPFCGQGFQGAGQAQVPGVTQPVAGTGAASVASTAQAAAPVAQATPLQAIAQPAVTAAPTAQQATGGIDAQVKASRGSSRRKMPMMVFVVLVTMALAGAAFAAAYIYTNFFANNGEQATQVEEAAQPEQDTGEAVYDSILQQWVDAANSGWPEVNRDGVTADLYNVADVASGRANNMGGVHAEEIASATIQYAYKDLNADGQPELIVGIHSQYNSATDFVTLAVYTSDGTDVASATQGQGWNTSSWTIYKSGCLQLSGGGNSGGTTRYELQDGEVVETGSWTNREILTGAVEVPDAGEVYAYDDFEWHDLVTLSDDSSGTSNGVSGGSDSTDSNAQTTSSHSYENDYFYVDSESNVDTTVTDNGDGTWTVQWEAKPGARDTGGRVIVHMGGTPTQYSNQVGTASNGQLIWVEGVAGGTCGTFGVK